MTISRYPRREYRIAPHSLREILGVSVLGHLREMEVPYGLTARSLKLSDLDETAWDLFGSELCHRMSTAVISAVSTRLSTLPPAITQRHLPALPEGTCVEDLQLEVRSYNCLQRLIERGVIANLNELETLTIGKMLKTRNFGAKSLVDLLTSIETFHLPADTKARPAPDVDVGADKPLVEAAIRSWLADFNGVVPKRIRALNLPKPPTGCGRLDDIDLQYRTKRCLRKAGFGTNLEGWGQVTIGDLLKINGFGKLCLLDLLSALLIQGTRTLPISGDGPIGLDREMVEVIKSGQPKRRNSMCKRNTRVCARYLGWDGRGGAVLQTVGDEFGFTRERVRQICDPIIEKIRRMKPNVPSLAEVIRFVASHSPGKASDIEAQLAQSSLTSLPFRLEGILSAAEVLQMSPPFEIASLAGTRWALRTGARNWPNEIRRLARKSISRWGVATAEDVAAQFERRMGTAVPVEFVALVLQDRPDFLWLDESSGWFWLRSVPRNRLLTQIEKVMAVAGCIEVSELRGGLSRFHRLKGFAPPRRVLLELCRQLPEFTVENNIIVADPPLDLTVVLSEVEQLMVRVVRQDGPVLQTPTFEAMCLSAGMNRATFYMYLLYSPIIERYSKGVYGLRGAEIPVGIIESVAPKRRRTRVLKDYGWTNDGKIWLGYRLSKALVANGVPSIPAAMKDLLHGEFQIKAPDGSRFGTFVSRETGAWGLGPFFRRRGAEANDFFVLVFDIKTRDAVAYLGDESLFDDALVVGGSTGAVEPQPAAFANAL